MCRSAGVPMLKDINREIKEACGRCGRDSTSITLVGASKRQTVATMLSAARQGLKDFGENYWQELVAKREAIQNQAPELAAALSWHYIGRLQRRKLKDMVAAGVLIHSLADQAQLVELERRAEALGKTVTALIQVNLDALGKDSKEVARAGCTPRAVSQLLQEATSLSHVKLMGLMVLPPYQEDPEAMRPFFKALRELRDEMNGRSVYKELLTELSMGMSHDFEIAIEEGATMIRIGTALFGPRENIKVDGSCLEKNDAGCRKQEAG